MNRLADKCYAVPALARQLIIPSFNNDVAWGSLSNNSRLTCKYWYPSITILSTQRALVAGVRVSKPRVVCSPRSTQGYVTLGWLSTFAVNHMGSNTLSLTISPRTVHPSFGSLPYQSRPQSIRTSGAIALGSQNNTGTAQQRPNEPHRLGRAPQALRNMLTPEESVGFIPGLIEFKSSQILPGGSSATPSTRNSWARCLGSNNR